MFPFVSSSENNSKKLTQESEKPYPRESPMKLIYTSVASKRTGKHKEKQKGWNNRAVDLKKHTKREAEVEKEK